MSAARSRRRGWIGIAIVLLGTVVALGGLVLILRGRPEVGELVDTIVVDGERSLIVRNEVGGERNFLELVEHGELAWRTLIPPYAGRPGAPGIAWGQGTVTVRVLRDGRAEVFALAMTNAHKLGGFKLAPGRGEAIKQARGPVTLTDHERSYELVTGRGWSELVAIDLAHGEALWRVDLGADAIDHADVDGKHVIVEQAGKTRRFDRVDGSLR
jgi:hypothetical protein